MTVHTAPGQTAGYLYQCRYALLLALQHTASSPNLLLSIEHLDDVAFEEGAEPFESAAACKMLACGIEKNLDKLHGFSAAFSP